MDFDNKTKIHDQGNKIRRGFIFVGGGTRIMEIEENFVDDREPKGVSQNL